VMATLLRRELAEHRLLFLYTPMACTLMYVVWMVARMLDYSPPEIDVALRPDGTPVFSPEKVAQEAAEIRSYFIAGGHVAFAAALQTVFWAGMTFYCLSTLYQQRKERSVLFWNSMPVSDTQTVISKLLAGLVGCHAIYLLATIAGGLLTPVIVWTYGAVLGTELWDSYVHIWSVAWVPQYLGMMLINTLWSLPVYAWLLLASAWSRRAPFVWAVSPLLLVVIVEVAVRQQSWVRDTVLMHLVPTYYFGFSPDKMDPVELAIGTLLGAIFIYAAIRFNRPDDR
jgi:ABC-2 type transport system permease protein